MIYTLYLYYIILSSVTGDGDPELWINEELRVKIKDMRIDPQSLSYNPKSQPLGKGKIYRPLT